MSRTFTKNDSQAMKGIAILLMLLHHLFYSADSSHGIWVNYLFLTQRQTIAFARFCKICVPAFVFVTAYGMTLKYKAHGQGGKSIWKLTWYRYASLMASFLFVYVLALLFCQIGGMRSWGEVYGKGVRSVGYAVLDLLGMTYFTDTPSMNPTWWYMSVAVLLIFVLPLIWKLNQRLQLFLPLLLLAVTFAAGLEKNQTMLCILTAAVGVWSAEKDVFGRLEQFFRKSGWTKSLGILLYSLALLGMLVLKVRTGNRFWPVIYPVSAFALAGLLCRTSGDGRIFRILEFFGRHSMYMFMTHTFLKSYYLHDFLYGLCIAPLIYAALLVISVALAVVLGFLEKKCRVCMHFEK